MKKKINQYKNFDLTQMLLIAIGLIAIFSSIIAWIAYFRSKKAMKQIIASADTTGDGKIDTILLDTDGNEIADTILIDTNGDGEADQMLVDTDEDGEIDLVIE